MKPEIIVSYSEVFKYQTCQRQYYYRFIKGLQPIEESDAITTGVNGHKLLQDFYELMRQGASKNDALTAVADSALKLINRDRFADFNLLKAWTLVDKYIRETEFTGEAVLIENRFLLPVARLTDDPELSHVQIGFTPDLVLERSGRFLDVEDSKFVQRAWSKKKLERYQQTKLYQIFLSEMGYTISRTLIRFFNTQTTDITTYPYVLKAEERTSLTEDFLAGVRDVVRYKESPTTAHRTMCYTACQYCAFVFPCTLEAQGKDASKVLSSMYVKSRYDYTQ